MDIVFWVLSGNYGHCILGTARRLWTLNFGYCPEIMEIAFWVLSENYGHWIMGTARDFLDVPTRKHKIRQSQLPVLTPNPNLVPPSTWLRYNLHSSHKRNPTPGSTLDVSIPRSQNLNRTQVWVDKIINQKAQNAARCDLKHLAEKPFSDQGYNPAD